MDSLFLGGFVTMIGLGPDGLVLLVELMLSLCLSIVPPDLSTIRTGSSGWVDWGREPC